MLSGTHPLYSSDAIGDPVPGLAAEVMKRHREASIPPSHAEFDEELPVAATPAIYRWFFDVTGDGVDELFLASSADSDRNIRWNVYVGSADGGWRLGAENVIAGPRGLHLESMEGSATLTSYTRLEDETYGLAKFVFRPDGSVSDESRTLSDAERAARRDIAQRQALFGMKHPVFQEIEEASAEVVVNNPELTVWRPFNRELSPGEARFWNGLPESELKNATSVETAGVGRPRPLPSADDRRSSSRQLTSGSQEAPPSMTTSHSERSYSRWLLLFFAIFLVGVSLLWWGKKRKRRA